MTQIMQRLSWKFRALLPNFSVDPSPNNLYQDLPNLTQPVALLFDTYDKVSPDFQDWFEKSLLRDIADFPAVAIVIAGENVPVHKASVWEDYAFYFQLGAILDANKYWLPWVSRYFPVLKDKGDIVEAFVLYGNGIPGIILQDLSTLSQKYSARQTQII